MKGGTPFLLGLLAVLGIGAYSMKKFESALAAIKPSLREITLLKGSTLFTSKIRVRISLFNPNSRDIEFQSFTGVVTAGGYKLSSINSIQSILLKASMETNLSIDLKINNLTALTTLAQQLLANTPPVATVKGTLVAGGIEIPIEEKLELKWKDETTVEPTNTPTT